MVQLDLLQVMDFSLMAQEATGVRKTWNLLASFYRTFIWSIVFIHVFIPFAFSVESSNGFIASVLELHQFS